MPKQIKNLAAILAIALVSGCNNGADQGRRDFRSAQDERIPAVEAVQVLYGSLPLEERLSGSVRARNQTEIYAEVAAPVVEVLVNDGDNVAAGEVLLRLRSTDYEERVRQAESGLQVADARVRQAQASLTRAEATLNRMRTLHERGLASTVELEEAEATALSAQADVELMRAQRAQAASQLSERRTELGNTVVRAPITGVVGGRNAEIGQRVDGGTQLFSIGDPSEMRVRITLTERMLSYIQEGTSVNIVTDAAPERVIRARIDRISPFLHPVTHTTEAEMEVGQHDGVLRPGMFVTVDVLYGESELAALVPNAAIYRHPRDGREGVYVASLADVEDPDAVPGDEPGVDPDALLSLSPEEIGPRDVVFVPVQVVARGRLVSGVAGVEPGAWVVTLGHRLLSNRDSGQALIQPTPWEHIMNLQQMQSRDLLNIILEKLADRDVNDASGALN
jgi:HlyD family secretion protein